MDPETCRTRTPTEHASAADGTDADAGRRTDRVRAWLRSLADDIERLRHAVFLIIAIASIIGALNVAVGNQYAYVQEHARGLVRSVLFGWSAALAVLAVAGHRMGRAFPRAILSYGCFFVLLFVFEHLSLATAPRVGVQLAYHNVLLFVGLVLLGLRQFIVFSAVTSSVLFAWLLFGTDLPGAAAGWELASFATAVAMPLFWQAFLTAVAAALIATFYGRMVASREELARHNEHLEEEVERRALVIEGQRKHLHHAEKMRAIGTLAAGMAHDLNNVITGINGNTFILTTLVAGNARALKSIGTIEHCASRATELLKRLRRFTKGSSEPFCPVNPNDAVANVHGLLSPSLPTTIRFDIACAPDVLAVHGSEAQIEEALMNLCLNARDAMPNGGTLTVRTSACALTGPSDEHPWIGAGRYSCITVTDTGAGMDDETLKRMFEPFFSTKEDKGTGLGLAMVHAIVDDHHGHVVVRSTPGVGSTFTIWLPGTTAVPPRQRAATPSAGTVTVG